MAQKAKTSYYLCLLQRTLPLTWLRVSLLGRFCHLGELWRCLGMSVVVITMGGRPFGAGWRPGMLLDPLECRPAPHGTEQSGPGGDRAHTHPWAPAKALSKLLTPCPQSGGNSGSCPWQGHPAGPCQHPAPVDPQAQGLRPSRPRPASLLGPSPWHSAHSDGSQSILGLLRTNSDHSAEQLPKTQAALIPESSLQGGSQECLLALGSPPPRPPRPHPYPAGMWPSGL